MDALTGVKVGDKLFVNSRNNRAGRIVAVDRITPKGRVITKAGEFNPNGKRRGEYEWGTTLARLATEDDISRYGIVQKLERFRLWDKLSADDLKAASEIIAKYEVW